MKRTFTYIDLERCRSADAKPVDVIRCDPSDWLVAGGQLNTDNFQWDQHKSAQYVMVPLVPYLVIGTDAENSLGYLFQLGSTAIRVLPESFNILEEHISIGVPLEEVVADLDGIPTACFRFWLGVAYCVS